MNEKSPNPTSPSSDPASEPSEPVITRFVLGPFATNCYVVSRDNRCFVVDAGFEPNAMIDHLGENGLQPEALFLTHAHVDHIAGVFALRSAFPDLPIIMHGAEADWMTDPLKNLSGLSGLEITAPPADRFVDDDETLDLIGLTWRVRHVPGHSPGSVVLLRPGVALVGDTLFAGSIGRTDFPGSDHEALLDGIRTKLYALDDETIVLPGHNEPTTIGREKSTNPYVRG